MCNLSEGVYERGDKAGYARGVEKERMSVILEMLKMNMEYDVIAKIAKVSSDQIAKIAKENLMV